MQVRPQAVNMISVAGASVLAFFEPFARFYLRLDIAVFLNSAACT